MNTQTIDQRVAALAARHAAAVAEAANAATARQVARRAAKHTTRARVAGQAIARAVQQRAHQRIARVVSRCLAAVFDEPYEFEIEFERKRGKTEARLKFTRDGHEIDPMTASAGGVVDVAAFALRLANIVQSQPPLRRLLVLDEPFKFVHSEEYRERIRLLIMALAKEMGVQFIIVTGEKEFEIGKVVRL